nr:bifunctional nuclease family protein [Corynebacterium lactis]
MAHPPEDDPVLLLHDEEGNRIIPIWIGVAEAALFAARDSGSSQRRPSMHEVFVDGIELAGQNALRGQITGVHEGVFIASLVFEGDIEVDMRPSDLILIADLLEVPLYAAREVVDAVSVPARMVATNGGSLADADEVNSVEASVEEFAEFLDSIDADYFANNPGESREDQGVAGSDGDDGADGVAGTNGDKEDS